MKKLSKHELVKLINALPGDKVTTRPKKSVLEEIYRERMEEVEMVARQVEDDMDEVCCDMTDCCPCDSEWGITGRLAIVTMVVVGLAGIIYLVS